MTRATPGALRGYVLVVTDRACEATDVLFFEHLAPRLQGALRIARVGVDGLAAVLAGASAVVIVRSLMELGHVSRCARRLGVPCYYFLDDNFMLLREEPDPFATWFKEYTNDGVRAALQGFEGTLLATPALVGYFRAHQLHEHLTLYPPVAGTASRREPTDPAGPITIAFFGGSHRREAFVQFVFPAIRRLADDREVVLVAAGVDPALAPSTARLQVVHLPYNSSYVDALRAVARHRIDILVHPGSPGINNPYKNPHVLINAWMMSAAPIFSDLPPYAAVAADGVAVVSNNTEEDWHRAIASLARDTAGRREMVERLATYCAAQFGGQLNEHVITSMLRAHASPGRSPRRRARAAVCLGLGRMSRLAGRVVRRATATARRAAPAASRSALMPLASRPAPMVTPDPPGPASPRGRDGRTQKHDSTRAVRALYVAGAYFPEISAGGLQCQDMARLLAGRVAVQVLTTTWDRHLARHEVVDGVPVWRVAVDVTNRWSRLGASMRMLADLLRLVRWCDVVHVQGTSAKNLLVISVAKLFRRRVVISLQTSGHDEPAAIARQGRLAWRAFTAADVYLGVSPALVDAYLAAGLPPARIQLVPNGVDTDRFMPADASERQLLRARLGLPDLGPIVVFVGYFSVDKQPHVLFDAWCRLQRAGTADTTLVFVGATRSEYFEVDAHIVDQMRDEAARMGVGDRLVFTGPTHAVHQYLRAADVFALPSRREGAPVALLEAMACGLPCAASRLPGSTDVIIDDGVNGVLVPAGDAAALAAALQGLLADRPRAALLGAEARATIVRRFASAEVARRWLMAYRERGAAA